MLAVAVKRFLRGGSNLGIASGIVVIFALIFAGTMNVSKHVASEAIVQNLNNSAASDANLHITFDGSYSQTPESEIRAAVAQALNISSDAEVLNFVTFRALADAKGNVFQVIGIPAEFLSDVKGSLPVSCSELDCPMLLVRGSDQVSFASIRVVGKASFLNSAVLQLAAQPDSTILVTNDVSGLENLSTLSSINRTRIWSKVIGADDVERVGPRLFLKNLSEKSDDLALVSNRLVLHYPDQQIQAAIAQAGGANSRIVAAILLLAILTLLALSILTSWAQPVTNQAATVIEQLTGVPQYRYRLVAAVVSLTPGSAAVVAFTILGLPKVEYLWIFTIAAALLMIATLEFGFVAVALGFTISTIGVGIALDEPLIGVLVVSALLFFPMRMALERLQARPFGIAITRANELRFASILASVFMFVIASWTSTIADLDQQQRNHIAFEVPLANRYSGLEAGIFQEISLEEYQSTANAWPITKLAATSAGKSFAQKPIQIVGLPADLAVPDQTAFGGPSQSQLLNLAQNSEAKGELGVTGISSAPKVLNIPLTCEVGLWIIDENGQSRRIEPGANMSAGAKLIGVEIFENPNALARREHAANEGKHAVAAPEGLVEIEFGSDYKISRAVNLSSGPIYLPLVNNNVKLLAIASPELASPGEELTVKLGGDSAVQIKVIDNATRFATAPTNFLIVNQAVLYEYLATTNPELIRATEIWTQEPIDPSDVRLSKLQTWSNSALTEKFLQDPIRKTTRQAFYTFTSVLFLALLLLVGFSRRAMTKSLDLQEWQNRGKHPKQLNRELNRILIFCVTIMGAAGGAFGVLSTYLFASRESTMWNGLTATPPVAASFNWTLVASLSSILFLLATLVVNLSRGKHDNSH